MGVSRGQSRVGGRPLSGFTGTHRVPESGSACWGAPDPTEPPVATAQAGLPVEIVARRDDWAQVRFENGWLAWVDARPLVEVPSPGEGAGKAASPAFAIGPVRITGAIVGAGLLVVSTFLPWVSVGGVAESGPFDIPAMILVDKDVQPGGLDLGYLVLALAAAGFATAVRVPTAPRRAVAGAVAAVVVAFIVQLQRLLGGAEFLSVFGNLGLGVITAAGAAYLLWTGSSAAPADGGAGTR